MIVYANVIHKFISFMEIQRPHMFQDMNNPNTMSEMNKNRDFDLCIPADSQHQGQVYTLTP